MSDEPETPLKRIKTGRIERRLSLARAGLIAGSRLAAHSATQWFVLPSKRAARARRALGREAEFLVAELGRLKGSVVKIGQMMAIYGEHFLPEEVTAALHTLENRTTALSWAAVQPQLRAELGARRLAGLAVEPSPLAAASLAQVHRAWRRADGRELCLKIQYPGVAETIDADIGAVVNLLRLGGLVRADAGFSAWLDEVRALLHAEVDYAQEAESARRCHARLRGDRRYAVPEVIAELSTGRVLASSYEPGLVVGDAAVAALPLERRNALARAYLELFFREVFEWGEMQADPNFGNYLVRPARDRRGHDRLVLLDFGAWRVCSPRFLQALRAMIRGAFHGDQDEIVAGACLFGFISREDPLAVQRDFARVCATLIEPFVAASAPASARGATGAYSWRRSDLPARVAKLAGSAALSRNFRFPGADFVFLNRKLLGVYTFIAMLDAEFDGAAVLAPFLRD